MAKETPDGIAPDEVEVNVPAEPETQLSVV